MSESRVTLADLAGMKREGRKIVGVVAWDYQIARIVDRVGVELVSVGDTVGMNLWGQGTPFEVTLDQMVTVCQASGVGSAGRWSAATSRTGRCRRVRPRR
jgi:3-methyl-2-oxobutanoate hydroxymethyltransferase